MNLIYNEQTNRIITSGYLYDANGNLTAMPGLAVGGGLAGAVYFGVVGAVIGATAAVLTSSWLLPVANNLMKQLNRSTVEAIANNLHADCDRIFPIRKAWP